MKRVLIFSIILGSLALVVPAADAKTSFSAAVEQRVVYVGPPQRNRRWNRRPYSVIRTRIVRIGFRRYRETVRITYLPNGRTRYQVIRRVRIR